MKTDNKNLITRIENGVSYGLESFVDANKCRWYKTPDGVKHKTTKEAIAHIKSVKLSKLSSAWGCPVVTVSVKDNIMTLSQFIEERIAKRIEQCIAQDESRYKIITTIKKEFNITLAEASSAWRDYQLYKT